MSLAPAWVAALSGREAALYGLVAALLLLEAGLPHRAHPGDSIRRWTFHGLLLLASRGVGWAIAGGIAWAGASWLGPGTTNGSSPAHLLAAFLALDLLLYALHRASHHLPLLWRFHRLHHSDTMLDIGSSWRHHPVEMIIAGLVVGLAAAISGISTTEIGLYAAAAEIVQILAHANIRLHGRAMSALSYVVITPNLHHLHHAPDQADTDTNYGEVLSVWDRLFGTFNARPGAPAVFGLHPSAPENDAPPQAGRQTRFGR